MGDYLKHRERLRNVADMEAKGMVADSKEYRMALMNEVHAGTKTLEQAQAELKRVKSAAKRNGQITRDKAYTGRY